MAALDFDTDEWIETVPISDILLTAPPGCGKTDQLARRAAHLIQSGAVAAPQQILALTFSHKAKVNLRARLASSLSQSGRNRVSVRNLHGLGLHLLRHHAPVAGRTADNAQPVLRGSLRSLRREISREFGISLDELDRVVRESKAGATTDDEVISRLRAQSPAALEYENRLRSSGRTDHDDAIRLGQLILANKPVLQLYRERFACVLVDEVQDLTWTQFEFIAELGRDRTVFAGDRAQGIFGFAGAAPDQVYEAITERNPVNVALASSYRSSTNVLRIVSAISVRLGGTSISAAIDSPIKTPGWTAVEHFDNPSDEARRLLELVSEWTDDNPAMSVAVIARAKHRRETLDELIRERDVPVEVWDYPVHRPSVVTMLGRHVASAVSKAGERADGVQELYLLCLESTGIEDHDVLDELAEATDALLDLVEDDPLTEVVKRIRSAADPNAPAGPGLHLLNAHVGKGQQFDRVVVLGLEDGHVPYYRARTPEEIADELAVLHVMISRARDAVLFTHCRDVPYQGSPWLRKPSRWLQRLEELAGGER